MPTEEQVKEKLEGILVPGVMRSLVKMNLLSDIKISDHKVEITLASAAIHPGAQDLMKEKIEEALKQMPEVQETIVNFTDGKPKDINKIDRVIAVMSGKGGVGKSLVTALLAASLARQGKEVGVLDADITGPSIPKIFGLSKGRPSGSDSGLLPVPSRLGIEIMSINLVLEHEDDAVIWRGPLIGKVIQQFWDDVLWGKLDYLLVDLPPGTADAPLTVMQSLPLSGVVIVFSPQELAAMVVKKAVKMATTMNIPILGLVENMSYFEIPGTKKRLELFGKSRVEEMVNITGVSNVVRIPIDPELARLCDEGKIEKYQNKEFDQFAQKLTEFLNAKTK
jgi:Mrp family chromosome partitioning ATPase